VTNLNQSDFEAALAEAANEWPDDFNNTADERRVTVNDRIDGHEVMSKMVQVPLDKVGHDYIAQAFRVLFNEFNNRVRVFFLLTY
jgi:hypothetical protein